jgi:predicted lipoprotein with Yx(FWY)xxD motif
MRTFSTFLAVAAAALAFAAGALPAAGPAVAVHGSRYGQVLFDQRGFVLYAFTRDGRAGSRCSGACAKAWPPFVVSRAPRAAAGTQARLLGTTHRRDGRLQVTYAGRPLYYYVGDRRPLQILCQDVEEFGGLWLVVRPNGTLVR